MWLAYSFVILLSFRLSFGLNWNVIHPRSFVHALAQGVVRWAYERAFHWSGKTLAVYYRSGMMQKESKRLGHWDDDKKCCAKGDVCMPLSVSSVSASCPSQAQAGSSHPGVRRY